LTNIFKIANWDFNYRRLKGFLVGNFSDRLPEGKKWCLSLIPSHSKIYFDKPGANDKPKIPHRDNRKMPHPFVGF
jgi:hypothetical protein